MASELLPEESASQQGTSVSFGFGLQNLDLSKFVLPVDEYLAVVRDQGRDDAKELLQFFKGQQALFDRCISMQYGAMRSAGGSAAPSRSSSSVDSGASRGLGGLMGSRVRSVVGSRRFVRAVNVPDGLCYTKLLKDTAVQSSSSLLGKWPTVASLLRSPAVNFQSLDELERFRLVGDPEVVHVRAGGQDGFSFVSTFTRLASSGRYPVGTLGAVLASSGRDRGPAMKLHSRTAVGGPTLRFSSGGPSEPGPPVPIGGLFDARGSEVVGSICSVPFRTAAVLLCTDANLVDSDQVLVLRRCGLTELCRDKILVDSVVVDVLYFSQDVGMGVVETRALDERLRLLSRHSSLRVCEPQSFLGLRAKVVMFDE